MEKIVINADLVICPDGIAVYILKIGKHLFKYKANTVENLIDCVFGSNPTDGLIFEQLTSIYPDLPIAMIVTGLHNEL